MVEFAQRPMVAQGMPPSAPNAVGTGITSGLVPENSDPIIQQGMKQFENTVENLYEKVDEAENMEEVMNSIRGDEQPMKARVSELAELVGQKDAKKTPESVLAVMQPYFQILEMVQAQASDAAPGGIADAPMAGGRQSTVNFNEASPIQAPGSDEAAMRIAMGETPVNFAHGGYHAPVPNIPSYTNTPFPTYEMPDYSGVQDYAQDFMNIRKAMGVQDAPTDVSQILENQNKFLQPFMIEPRSQEEILAEQQALFGDQDQKDMETQGSLALAKFGAGVAQTPGSLLQALTANVPTVATDMSKIAAQKAALDRSQKEFAYSTAAAEEREQRTTNLNLALDAVKTAAANGKSNMAATNAAINAGIELGIGDAQEAADLVNKVKEQAFNAAMLAAGKPEAIYGGINPSTGEYEGFRTTFGREGQGRMAIDKQDPLKLNAIPEWAMPISESDHLAMTQKGGTDPETGKYKAYRTTYGREGQGRMAIDPDNPLKLIAIPDGFLPISESDHLAMVNAGKTDWSKAQKTTFTIPSNTSPDGWQQVEGVFLPNEGYYLTPDGGYENAVRPPVNSIVGPKSEVVNVAAPDSAGRIFITIKPPNGESYSYVSGLKRLNDEGELVSINVEKPAYSLQKAEFSKNETGTRIYEGGNPLVFERPPVGIAFEQMSDQQILKSRGKMEAHVYTLEAGERLLAEIRNAIGPVATLKNLSNNLAGFLPAGDLKKLAQHFETEEARKALLLFERTIQKSENLSDRYAVAEQKIIADSAPKLEFFKDPEVAMVGFQTYLLRVQNMLANERHSLDPSKPRLALAKVPRGTETDPFKFYDKALPAGPTSHFDYLTMIASDTSRPADLTDIKVSITGPQLEYILRNDTTTPNKESIYKKPDGSYKDNILINASTIIDLTM